jgi:hypothetical protein
MILQAATPTSVYSYRRRAVVVRGAVLSRRPCSIAARPAVMR